MVVESLDPLLGLSIWLVISVRSIEDLAHPLTETVTTRAQLQFEHRSPVRPDVISVPNANSKLTAADQMTEHPRPASMTQEEAELAHNIQVERSNSFALWRELQSEYEPSLLANTH